MGSLNERVRNNRNELVNGFKLYPRLSDAKPAREIFEWCVRYEWWFNDSQGLSVDRKQSVRRSPFRMPIFFLNHFVLSL